MRIARCDLRQKRLEVKIHTRLGRRVPREEIRFSFLIILLPLTQTKFLVEKFHFVRHNSPGTARTSISNNLRIQRSYPIKMKYDRLNRQQHPFNPFLTSVVI